MKMKKTTLGMMMAATLLASSCLSEEQNLEPKNEGSQKGKIVLNLSTETNFDEQTRALNEADFRNTANYTVQLLQGTNVIETWRGPQSNLEFERTIGSNNSYTIKAFYGTEEKASRNTFYVEGSTSFILAADDEKEVNVNCAPTCGKISAVFDNAMATYYDDYSIEYSGTQALGSEKLTWAKNDTDPWYVLLKDGGEEISYTLTLKAKEAYQHVDKDGNKSATGTATGKFTLKRNEAHKLTVKPNYTPNENGTFTLTITIDETVNDRHVNIEVPVEWI